MKVLMRRDKILGILGGMGPEATSDCYLKIVRNTRVRKEQDHIETVIVSNPKIPDRTSALQGLGESPVDQMIQGCRRLKAANVDFVIIPCVTAHSFLDMVQQQTDLPVLSILDAVTREIRKTAPEIRRVGLMATSGTIDAGIFQKRLALENIEVVVPDSEDQQVLMEAITTIKKSGRLGSGNTVLDQLQTIANRLIRRHTGAGAQAIVAGCTEIPLLLSQDHLPVPYFDSLTILARTAIRYAGLEPVR